MTIVGFNFTKISAKKLKVIKEKVNIKNNVTIKELTETDLALGVSKQKGLRFDFQFISKIGKEAQHETLQTNIPFCLFLHNWVGFSHITRIRSAKTV